MQSDAFKMLPDQQHALKVSKAKLPMVQVNGPLSDLQLYTLVSNNIKRTLIKGFFFLLMTLIVLLQYSVLLVFM